MANWGLQPYRSNHTPKAEPWDADDDLAPPDRDAGLLTTRQHDLVLDLSLQVTWQSMDLLCQPWKENEEIEKNIIVELMDAVNSYIADHVRVLDKCFLMPVEGFSQFRWLDILIAACSDHCDFEVSTSPFSMLLTLRMSLQFLVFSRISHGYLGCFYGFHLQIWYSLDFYSMLSHTNSTGILRRESNITGDVRAEHCLARICDKH